MKNVIILSCSTGQGHNSCAEAIREYLEKKNITCTVCDSLRFISPAFARFMSWGHSFMYKHIPGLFRWGYSFNEEHRGILKRGGPFYRLLTIGVKRLDKFLADGGYDTVICTHVFPTIALTRALELSPLPVKTAYVGTDYTCSPGTETGEMDVYFIPDASLTEEFDRYIRTPHRTVASGIPVRSGFWTRLDTKEAKRTIGIGENRRHLLMMCGSMGCGPMVKLLGKVAGALPEDLEVTAICGTNRRLYEKLKRRYSGSDRIHILGFSEDVSVYMDSADLYLTKPGGISVTEAAAKRLPMAFINPVSGCDNYNMEFFVKMGAAIADTSVDRLTRKCLELLSSEERLSGMRRALEEYSQPNGAEIICEELSKGV